MLDRNYICCGKSLRALCFVIGYMNLLASVVDMCCHMMVVAIITNGFQCDINVKALLDLDIGWMEPLLLILNLGTHGFYPFPLVLRYRDVYDADFVPALLSTPRCYPGMMHVPLVDVLNFLINLIWLKFVLSYVTAVHKKDLEPMRAFFGISLLKMMVQFVMLYFNDTYWFIRLLGILITSLFMLVINNYIGYLRREKESRNIEHPPSYIECLISGTKTPMVDKKEDFKEDLVLPVYNTHQSVPLEVPSIKL